MIISENEIKIIYFNNNEEGNIPQMSSAFGN